MTSDTPLDALVIGAGPAGLVGALYLRRFHRQVAIVDSARQRAARIPWSHNVPGFPDGIAGPELLRRLREQFAKVGGQVEAGTVDRLDRAEEVFVAHLPDRTLQARRVLLATGAVDREPPIDGIAALRDRGLLRQCPICDGFEHSGLRIAVIGHSDHAAREARFIRHFTDRITLVSPNGRFEIGDALQAELRHLDVPLLADEPRAVWPRPEGGLALRFADGREETFDAMYAALGCHPRNELALGLRARVDAAGNLVVDAHRQTVIPGLYAAGDVTGGLDQIAVAFGEAAIAATAIHNSI